MIKIDTSICMCGKCGKEFPVEWELELVSSASNRGMGEEYQYESVERFQCPHCGYEFEAELMAVEYPVGVLEYKNVRIIEDKTKKSFAEIPSIYFFDL